MALSTTQYGYIIDPMVPFTDGKGNTIKDGFARVFVAGSSTPVVTYRNFDGAANQDLIELDNSGRTKTSVIGSKGLTYKVCVYDQLHSQESPILTVDKVSVIGANITAGAGSTVVTGLDGLTTKPDGFVDASVVGTDGYVALDHTLVTDDLNTDAKVTAVENDRYVPLLNDDVNDPDSKMTLGRLWKWVLGKIKSLPTTITSFRTGDVIPVDGPSGTAKMGKDDLLEVTAENATVFYDYQFTKTITAGTQTLSINDIAITKSAGSKIIVRAEVTGNACKVFALCNQAYHLYAKNMRVGEDVIYEIDEDTTSLGVSIPATHAINNGSITIYVASNPSERQIKEIVARNEQNLVDTIKKAYSIDTREFAIQDCLFMGFLKSDTGDLQYDSYYWTTDYIYVKNCKQIKLDLFADNAIGLVFYDELKNVVRILPASYFTLTIAPPTEAVFMRATMRLGSNNSVIVTGANNSDIYTPYDQMKRTASPITFDESDLELVAVNQEIRTLPASDTNLTWTPYCDVVKMKVRGGKGRVYLPDCGTGLHAYALMLTHGGDSPDDVRHVFSYNTDGLKSLSLENLPEEDYWLYINMMRNVNRSVVYDPTPSEHFICNVSNSIEKPINLTGKSVLVMGDSIAKGVTTSPSGPYNDWAYNVFTALGASNVANRAVPGSMFYPTSPGSATIKDQIDAGSVSSYDYAFIMAGTNDFLHSLKATETAFVDAFEDFCDYCDSKFSSSQKVVFILPIDSTEFIRNMKDGLVTSVGEFAKVIAEIATAHGYGVINGNRFGFPAPDSLDAVKTTLLVDGVHPTDVGYKLMERSMLNSLN